MILGVLNFLALFGQVFGLPTSDLSYRVLWVSCFIYLLLVPEIKF